MKPAATTAPRCPLGARWLTLLALAPACRSAEPAAPTPAMPPDPHSFARPQEVRVRHVSLDLVLDFEEEQLRGTARLTVERFNDAAPLVLDCEGLHVGRVLGADGSERSFTVGQARPPLGTPIEVQLEPGDDEVTLVYHTRGDTEALLWLDPAQTAGGRNPFLFTQGQSILTRSWIPLQDSPGVRVTYDARVHAPEPLTVVMSAESEGRDADGAFLFRLDKPIPPYLIALACGELEFAAISERSGVWAEPEILSSAAAELEDTESMIVACERLFGPYRWGRYDLLILPPAFPFGGMENPLLTFATPTILAGDKSLVALVAHELAHSWSGNLVTNATWRDFWLNEGFTVYLEKRIMEEVYGLDRADLERTLDRAGLLREMERLEPWQQVLHIDLAGKHPDDGFSGVPYDKGALFLTRLEELYGRPRFDAFLTAWFNDNAFQSRTTADFTARLRTNLLDRYAQKDIGPAGFDLDEWLTAPGLPADAPVFESDAIAAVDSALARWRAGARAGAIDARGWNTQQWLRWIQGLPDEVSTARMEELDKVFRFTRTRNSEILCAWLEVAVDQGYTPADKRLEEFLTTVGRRKFLRPLYEALAKTEAGRERGRAIYERARPMYHALARGTVEQILGLDG